ncbi:hypothetical protein BDQ17DRAFT_1049943 [Cyathus striatus]|nr:hypothetical protein BDQ17DRAFT_1049943 [Cyathus striatus]
MFPQYVREHKPSPFAEEDRVMGKFVKEEEGVDVPEEELKVFEELIGKMELRELLDLPLVALSNGQMRRARIVKAILRKPELLLLDEPRTQRYKLDDTTRREVALSRCEWVWKDNAVVSVDRSPSPTQQTYPHLSRLISHLSPEFYDAFPRRIPVCQSGKQ